MRWEGDSLSSVPPEGLLPRAPKCRSVAFDWGLLAVLGHHLVVHRRDIPEISAQPYRTTLLPATVWCHVPLPSQHHITTPRERLIRRVTALLLLPTLLLQALMSMLTGRHRYF